MNKKIIFAGIRFLFIGLFLYTGIAKISNFENFRSTLEQSPILMSMSAWLSWLVPIGELLVVGLLIRKRWSLKGLYGSVVIMLLFAIYTIALSCCRDYIPCDCGGFIESLPICLHIWMNIILSGLAFLGVYIGNQLKQIDHSYFNTSLYR